MILGASGVIGRTTVPYLRSLGAEVLPLGSLDIDLTVPQAGEELAARLDSGDALVMLAGLTPDRGRDMGTLVKNLNMGIAVCEALRLRPVNHVVYLSSDAVYPMQDGYVNEATRTEPRDTYSTMHIAREEMLRRMTSAPLAILRTTQVFAAHDTHRAYGPSRFWHQAQCEKRMSLLGGGEETRDHILVNDVAELIRLCLAHTAEGVLNAATGQSLSFLQVADLVAEAFDPRPSIDILPRQQPITYRKFDISELRYTFPDYQAASLESGILQLMQNNSIQAEH